MSPPAQPIRLALVAAAALPALLSLGCVRPADLARRSELLSARAEKVRPRAYVCAPRELASVEASLAVAERRVGLGEGLAAKGSLDDAERLLAVAETLSRPARCEGDRDDDGILDSLDACPDEPESLDGVEDDDGCPENDRDGDGLVDGQDRCPDVPGPPEDGGCPPADSDGDGLPDRGDRCPHQAGPAANQGCPPPPPDRDGDGVTDSEDRCPDLPGSRASGGCPFRHIVVEEKRIVLKQKIFFRRGSARIERESYPVLDEIVRFLQARSELRIRVQGHTDDRGSARRNLRLSRARATRVRRYLVSRGVAPSRVAATGFGEGRPIAENDSPEGREINRRVEFHIVNPRTDER